MRTILIIGLFFSVSAFGQGNFQNEKEKIYKFVAEQFIDKNEFVVNETLVSIQKYDINANYKDFFDARFICLAPIRYENSVTGYLQSQGIAFDTVSIFRQIDAFKIDSIEKYQTSLKLVSYKKAPIFNRYFFSKYFKKKKAIILSPIFFDEKNQVAITKMAIISRSNKNSLDSSKLIILQKANQQWNILGVLNKLNIQ